MAVRLRRAAAFGLAAAALAACSADDGDTAATTTTVPAPPTVNPFGRTSTEAIGVDLLDDRLPLTHWDGTAVLMGSGGLVRLGVEEGAEVTPTEGVGPVDLLDASGDDLLLAVGHDDGPVAWRSTDGDTWEELDLTGLDNGTGEVTVTTLVGLNEAGFLAGGEVVDGDQVTLTLWRSEDGEAWEVLDSPGLSGEHLAGLAVAGDTLLAVREQAGVDGSTLGVMTYSEGGTWTEQATTGLEPLDLPDGDVVPSVTTIGSSAQELFVLFASVPTDEEHGERTPALFTSPDGEDWTTVPLEGPTMPDPFHVQTITSVDGGAVAVAEGGEGLDVWRFDRD